MIRVAPRCTETTGQPRSAAIALNAPVNLRDLGRRPAQRHPLDQLQHILRQPPPTPVPRSKRRKPLKTVRLIRRHPSDGGPPRNAQPDERLPPAGPHREGAGSGPPTAAPDPASSTPL